MATGNRFGSSGEFGRDRAVEVGLFRYALIRPATDCGLTGRQRGAIVRALAAAKHIGPFGAVVRVSRPSLDRWIHAYRTDGFEALLPAARKVEPRTDPQVLELAVALKREKPARTAAQVRRVLAKHAGSAPSVRTLQRHFAGLGLNTRPGSKPSQAYGRFEAAAANERWTGDALHGPKIAGKKTYLFAFIDDHSRALVGYRWSYAEDTLRLEAALRAGICARGIPKVLYLDNGAAMVSKQLLRALAVMGIQLTHSKPGQPAGRGKIERFFRTVRDQFLVELSTPEALAQVKDLTGLNELFTAWVETVYHQNVHSETGAKPLDRFLTTGPPEIPGPALLAEAFQWAEQRQVTKTATISLFGNVYQVDAALVGRKIEVVFDPLDMTELAVRYQGRDMGKAVPHKITRHVHPKADSQAVGPVDPTPTGIDYLKLVATRHQEQLAATINYATPTHKPEPEPEPEPEHGELAGQLALTDQIGSEGEGSL